MSLLFGLSCHASHSCEDVLTIQSHPNNGDADERIEGQARNEGKRQRAQLLLDFEDLVRISPSCVRYPEEMCNLRCSQMSDREKQESEIFREWLYMFVPSDRESSLIDTNGVINGVQRSIDKLETSMRAEIAQLNSKVAELHETARSGV